MLQGTLKKYFTDKGGFVLLATSGTGFHWMVCLLMVSNPKAPRKVQELSWWVADHGVFMIFKVHALPTSFKPSSIYKSYQSFSSSVAKCPCHSIATAQNLRTPSLCWFQVLTMWPSRMTLTFLIFVESTKRYYDDILWFYFYLCVSLTKLHRNHGPQVLVSSSQPTGRRTSLRISDSTPGGTKTPSKMGWRWEKRLGTAEKCAANSHGQAECDDLPTMVDCQ